ncbi:MAG: DUF2029 domain-containing protein [Polyangiaceae bacterium]|nr:DUF2029 domain-containing protein [Polyangiaceae bacterium]
MIDEQKEGRVAVGPIAWRRLLPPDRLRRIALSTVALNAGLYAIVVARGHFPFDALSSLVVKDLMGHLTGGALVNAGRLGSIYDVAAQRAVQVAWTQRPEALDLYISPPLVAYLYAPLARLPYGAAAATWTAISIASLALGGALVARAAPLPRAQRDLVFLLWASSYPLIDLLGSGQDTGLSLVLWAGGVLLSLERRDVASGLVFSLGLFKPQLFLLPPLVFLLFGRARALAAWAFGAAAHVGLTLAIFGGAGVSAWLAILRSHEYLDSLHTELAPKMTSLMPFGYSLAPPGWGTAGRFAGGALSLALVALAAVRCVSAERTSGADERGVWALAVLTTLIASPHLFDYDLALLIVPVALLWSLEPSPSDRARLAIAATYVLCWTVPIRLAFLHAPWPACALAASFVPVPLLVLWREIAVA